MQMQTPDLMTFLLEEYKKDVAAKKAEAESSGDSLMLTELELQQQVTPAFVAFARSYLATQNQPLTVTYAAVGLALRLQSGATVCFVPQGRALTQMRDEGIPITRPQSFPGQNTIVDTSGIPI